MAHNVDHWACTRFFVLKKRRGETPHIHIHIAKTVAQKAVVRNTIRRRIRHIVQNKLIDTSYTLIVRKNIQKLTHHELERCLTTLFKRHV